jgi:small subunit ribosomal protein S20
VPNSKSAKADVKKSRKRRLRNQSVRSAIKTFVKKTRETIAGGELETAQTLLSATASLVDKAAKRKIIHPNTAARRKSRLAKRMNAVRAAEGTNG